MAVQGSIDFYRLVHLSGAIPEDVLTEAQATSVHLNVPIEDVLVGRKIIGKDDLGGIIAKALGIAYVNLKDLTIPKEILNQISEQLAQERKVVPIARDKSILHLAMQDPLNLETINFFKKITGLNIIPAFAFDKDLKYGLRQYKSSLTESLSGLKLSLRHRNSGV